MANPTLVHPEKRDDRSNITIDAGGFAVDGKQVIKAQSPLVANAPAGGVGAITGAYDTAANRDLMIAAINNIITVLKNHGLMADA